MMTKVVGLKKSRDKLLEQLDEQSLEAEQLLAETQVGLGVWVAHLEHMRVTCKRFFEATGQF